MKPGPVKGAHQHLNHPNDTLYGLQEFVDAAVGLIVQRPKRVWPQLVANIARQATVTRSAVFGEYAGWAIEERLIAREAQPIRKGRYSKW
jgi:hypothetical protein